MWLGGLAWGFGLTVKSSCCFNTVAVSVAVPWRLSVAVAVGGRFFGHMDGSIFDLYTNNSSATYLARK